MKLNSIYKAKKIAYVNAQKLGYQTSSEESASDAQILHSTDFHPILLNRELLEEILNPLRLRTVIKKISNVHGTTKNSIMEYKWIKLSPTK